MLKLCEFVSFPHELLEARGILLSEVKQEFSQQHSLQKCL